MHLNTTERFYIYKEDSMNNHLNDDHTITNNKIFETILKEFQGTSHLHPDLLSLPLPAPLTDLPNPSLP